MDVVTLDFVAWAGLPDREEAGSPNVVGAVAMAAAANALMEVGMDRIAAHEDQLVAHGLRRLAQIPSVTIYGETDPARSEDKVGVIPFNLDGVHHALVASILGYEGGIGVRHGCFCAHPYVVHLLGLGEEEQQRWRRQALQGDHSQMPGMVRASFGCYNAIEDIDRLAEMLERIVARDYHGTYRQIPGSGEYEPEAYRERFDEFFALREVRPVGVTPDPRACGG